MGTHMFIWFGASGRRKDNTTGPVKAPGKLHQQPVDRYKHASSLKVIIDGKPRIIAIPRPQPPPSPRPRPRPGPIHPGPPPDVPTPPSTPQRPAGYRSKMNVNEISDRYLHIIDLPTPQPPPSPRPRPRPGPVPYPPPGVPTPPASP